MLCESTDVLSGELCHAGTNGGVLGEGFQPTDTITREALSICRLHRSEIVHSYVFNEW